MRGARPRLARAAEVHGARCRRPPYDGWNEEAQLRTRAARWHRRRDRPRVRRVEVHDRECRRRRRGAARRGAARRRRRPLRRRRRCGRRRARRRRIGDPVPEGSAGRGRVVRARGARVRIRIEPGAVLRHGRHLPEGSLVAAGARIRRRLPLDAVVSVSRHVRGRVARRCRPLRPVRPRLRLPHGPLRLHRPLRPGAGRRVRRGEVALPRPERQLSEAPSAARQRLHDRRPVVRLRIVHRHGGLGREVRRRRLADELVRLRALGSVDRHARRMRPTVSASSIAENTGRSASSARSPPNAPLGARPRACGPSRTRKTSCSFRDGASMT